MVPHFETSGADKDAVRVVPTFGEPNYGRTPPDMPIPNRLNLFLVAFVFCGGVFLLWLGSRATAWYAVAAVGAAFSYLMLTNYALLHEASHGNLNSGGRANYLLGVVTGLLFPIPFRLMRTTHQNHHHHNRTDQEMFDLYYPSDNRLLKWAQWYCLLCGLFWPLVPLGAMLFAVWPGLLRWRTLRDVDPARGVGIVANLERAAIRAIRLELLLIGAFSRPCFGCSTCAGRIRSFCTPFSRSTGPRGSTSATPSRGATWWKGPGTCDNPDGCRGCCCTANGT